MAQSPSTASRPSPRTPASSPVRRTRLTPDDRRRQLVGIGLAKLVDKPLWDLSIDEVAAQAGISRGLLFHYFPTKRDFYVACIEAAGRRILRNTEPDPALPPRERVHGMVQALVEQIDRRRAFYLSILHGTGTADGSLVEVYDRIWAESTARVMAALDVAPSLHDVVHAWWAYVEDRALSWSAVAPRRRTTSSADLATHCLRALDALLDTT